MEKKRNAIPLTADQQLLLSQAKSAGLTVVKAVSKSFFLKLLFVWHRLSGREGCLVDTMPFSNILPSHIE